MVAGWVVISGGPVMSKLRPIPQGVVPVCHPWSRASVNKTVIPLVVLTDLLGVGILVHGQSGDTPHRGAAVLPVPILRGLRGITPRQTQGLWQFQPQYSPSEHGFSSSLRGDPLASSAQTSQLPVSAWCRAVDSSSFCHA